jgi:SAM-dependent methyltransferase
MRFGISLSSCPVCGGTPTPWKTKITNMGSFPIDTCDACGYAFVNPRPSLNYLLDYYRLSGNCPGDPSEIPVSTAEEALQREVANPNSTIDAKRIIQTIRKVLHKTNKDPEHFLDVGCGYGFFTREAKRAGFEVHAIELASNERRIAQEIANISANAVSFEEFQGEANSFSVVLMSQILEHALDVNLWIAKANRILIAGGVLAVALPNFDSIFRRIMQEREPYICPPAHLNFFSPQNLKRLLEKHGFQLLETQWVSRIPRTAFEKRVPKIGEKGIPLVYASSKLLLKTFDLFHCGQMINLYARKVRQSEAT